MDGTDSSYDDILIAISAVNNVGVLPVEGTDTKNIECIGHKYQ